MTTGGGGGRDPFEDLFAEEDYEPALAFALTAARQAEERSQGAAIIVARETKAHGGLRNAIATSARKSAAIQLAALMALAQQTRGLADEARQTPLEDPGHGALVSEAIDTYDRAVGAYDDLLLTVQQLAAPDRPSPAAAAVALPPTQDAATVATAARQEALAWMRSVRGQVGKLCVLRNSPGVGKTETIIEAALDEQRNGRRAIVAVRTKAMLVGDNPEIVRRIAGKTFLTVRQHVILGRDENNCSNYDNVREVQAHGYAPGRTVCLGCEHHPRNAYALGLNVCDYFDARIQAHNDSRGARIGTHNTFPLILTCHASVVAAFDTGGGQFGAFWGCDTIFIDEDPTEAFESVTTLTSDQSYYRSPRPEDRATTIIARVFREAMAMAERERRLAEGVGFKIENDPNPNHRRSSSSYAGTSLHRIMERARDVVAQSARLVALPRMLRDVVEGSSFTTEPGRLFGLMNAHAINTVVPPIGLARVSETLLDEMSNVTALRRHLFETIRGHPPRGDTHEEIHAELLAHTDLEDFSYATRLEWLPTLNEGTGGWQFAAQGFAALHNHSANIIVGDAYAQVDHYERLFDRPCDKLVDRVAHFPEGTCITRLMTKSTISHLQRGFLQENLALLEAAIAEKGPGKRILVYGHQALRSRVEEWMKGIEEKYEIEEWAYEHWWGGRGKDFYNGWDIYLQVSEPIQNIDGMLHVVNARAFREAARSKAAPDRLAHTERIRFDLDPYPSFAHAMRASHERLFREHERQNINEQTQAVNRLRPVWNNVSCFILGAEVELSRDLLAATATSVPTDSRKVNLSKSQRKGKRIEGPVDAFLTADETLAAMLAIVEWFGIWSGNFAHALITVPVDFRDRTFPSRTVSGRISEATLKKSSLKVASEIRPEPVLPAPPTCPATPRETLVRRVWSPPVYWSRLNERAAPLNAIREATRRLKSQLPAVPCGRWPSWRGGGPGRKPVIYYDPQLFGELPRPDLALKSYYALIDNQYGPTRNGKLVAPDANPELPISWAKVPF